MALKIISDILSMSKMRLGIEESTDEDIWLKNEINECIRKFDIFENYVNVTTKLKIDCNRCQLPDDFYDLICLRGVGYADTNTDNNPVCTPTGTFYFLNEDCMREVGCCNVNTNQPQVYVGTYNLNGNQLELFGQFNSLQSAILTYKAYSLDSRGYFVNQPKELVSAVAWDICSIYSRKYPNNYDIDQKRYFDARALAEYNFCRGKSAVRRFNRNMPEMINICNSILISKDFYGRWSAY